MFAASTAEDLSRDPAILFTDSRNAPGGRAPRRLAQTRVGSENGQGFEEYLEAKVMVLPTRL